MQVYAYSIQKASTDSPSGTPSAIKKPKANQRGLFDDDEDDDIDEVFQASKSTRLESKSSSAKTSQPSEVHLSVFLYVTGQRPFYDGWLFFKVFYA